MDNIPLAASCRRKISQSKKFWMVCLFVSIGIFTSIAQPITGVYSGNIKCNKGGKPKGIIEVKLVAYQDNILGTIYYIGKGSSYIRYSIRGSISADGKSIFWQDQTLIKIKVANQEEVNDFKETMKYKISLVKAGNEIEKLAGFCLLPNLPKMKVELKRVSGTFFPDEWDAVIQNTIAGYSDKELIDSVWALSSEPAETKGVVTPAPGTGFPTLKKAPEMSQLNEPEEEQQNPLKDGVSLFITPDLIGLYTKLISKQ